jgi:hypothetical protein
MPKVQRRVIEHLTPEQKLFNATRITAAYQSADNATQIALSVLEEVEGELDKVIGELNTLKTTELKLNSIKCTAEIKDGNAVCKTENVCESDQVLQKMGENNYRCVTKIGLGDRPGDLVFVGGGVGGGVGDGSGNASFTNVFEFKGRKERKIENFSQNQKCKARY